MAGFGALFVAVCFVFSVIPLSTFFPDNSLPSLTVKSNQPSLALKVQNDLYLDPRKCQAEFSRFYPQLEENEKIWRVRVESSIPIFRMQRRIVGMVVCIW